MPTSGEIEVNNAAASANTPMLSAGMNTFMPILR